MTSEHKRRRGRPPGTGIAGDLPYLARVADLLVRKPGLTPTMAMRSLRSTWPGRETDETLLRRWQGKWKVHGSQLCLAAEARVEADRARRAADESYQALAGANRVLHTGLPRSIFELSSAHVATSKLLAPLQMSMPGSVWAAMAAQFENPSAKLAIARLNSPEVGAALKFMDSPFGKAAQAALRRIT